MSKLTLGILLLVVLALVPFALIARSRSLPSGEPPVHPILDMDKQPKFKTQHENPMFADGRAMRPVVPGAVAQQDLLLPPLVANDPEHPRLVDGLGHPLVIQDPGMYAAVLLGRRRPVEMTDDAFGKLVPATQPNDDKDFYVRTIPPAVPVTRDLLARGQDRYAIFCGPCHGGSGLGDGMVARRAGELQANAPDVIQGWIQPPTYHSDELRNRPDGHLFNTITHGIRSMPAYDKQIPVLDRWAIVAYVRALQRSQNATTADLPEGQRN